MAGIRFFLLPSGEEPAPDVIRGARRTDEGVADSCIGTFGDALTPAPLPVGEGFRLITHFSL